jgi:hypothetical protein
MSSNEFLVRRRSGRSPKHSIMSTAEGIMTPHKLLSLKSNCKLLTAKLELEHSRSIVAAQWSNWWCQCLYDDVISLRPIRDSRMYIIPRSLPNLHERCVRSATSRRSTRRVYQVAPHRIEVAKPEHVCKQL